MSNKRLVVLGIVAAVMVVLVVVQSRIGRIPERKAAGGYLIQGLETAQIGRIEIGKGASPVRLVRRGNYFVVGNKDDYPALISKINNLLTSCLDIRTIGRITTNPANHESLGVTEEKAQSVVRFLDGGGQIITGLVIGSSRLPELQMDKRTTYVRLISSDDVYEAQNVPLLGGSAMDYIDKEIVNVERSDVTRVTVTGPEGSYTLKVDDSNEDNIVLEDMAVGKKLKKYDCRDVLGGLSYLSFSDVKKESSFADGELRFDRTYVSELKDSTSYAFKVAKTEEKTYVKCSAEYTGDVQEILESKGELKDKESKLLAYERTVGFTGKHKGWVYEISEYKAKNLTRKLVDLLEEEKEEEKEEEEIDVSASTTGSVDPNSEQPK